MKTIYLNIDLENYQYLHKARNFSNPIIPIGFSCNKNIPYKIVQLHNNNEILFSDLSHCDSKNNLCFLYYKNDNLKHDSLEDIVNYYQIGCMHIKITVGNNYSLSKLDDIKFKHIYGEYHLQKCTINGYKTGMSFKKKRLVFKKVVCDNSILLDSKLLDENGISKQHNKKNKSYLLL